MKKIITIAMVFIVTGSLAQAQDSTSSHRVAMIASYAERASIGVRYWYSDTFILVPAITIGYKNKTQKGIGSASDQIDKSLSLSGSCAIESQLDLQSFITPFLHGGIEAGYNFTSHTPSLTSVQLTTTGQLLESQTSEIPISLFAGIGVEGKIADNISILFTYDIIGTTTINTTTQKSFKLNDNNVSYSVFDIRTNTSALWISFLL